MPKGQKIVDWTPENEAKLFHTIIAVHDIKVDNAKVAKAFGKFYPDPTKSNRCSISGHSTITPHPDLTLFRPTINLLNIVSRSQCTRLLHCHENEGFEKEGRSHGNYPLTHSGDQQCTDRY